MKRDEPPGAPIVLVVEDEFLVGMDIAGCLDEAGFQVIEAANADDAIRILSMLC